MLVRFSVKMLALLGVWVVLESAFCSIFGV